MRPYLNSISDHDEIKCIKAAMRRKTHIHQTLYYKACQDLRGLEIQLHTAYSSELCNYYLTSLELRQHNRLNLDMADDMSLADISLISAAKDNESQILHLLEQRLKSVLEEHHLEVHSANNETPNPVPMHITGRQLITQFMMDLYKENVLRLAQALTSPKTLDR